MTAQRSTRTSSSPYIYKPISAVGGYPFCTACERLLSAAEPFEFSRKLREFFGDDTRAGSVIDLDHHQTLDHLLAAVHRQCPICVRVLFALQERNFPPVKERTPLCIFASRKHWNGAPSELNMEVFAGTEPTKAELDQGGTNCELFTLNFHRISQRSTTGPLAQCIVEPNPSQQSNTASFDISRWITECSSHHSCLANRQSKYTPPRLLYCQENSIRLVERSQLPTGKSIRYIALSHCWGRSPTHMVLRTDNVSQFLREITFSDLPRTFQDAVRITRGIGVGFLWIDSLCIIQKGERHQEDWRLHVREMAGIYSNCFLNIAASFSDNSNGGCFQDRHPGLSRPCIANVDGQSFALEPLSYSTRLDRLALNSRAWVFQERLLSPRVVHYGQKNVFWECHEKFASDTYPLAVPDRKPQDVANPYKLSPFDWRVPATAKMDPIDRQTISPHWQWMNLIRWYSGCRLTNTDDRLPAIAGIAQRMNDEYFREKYIAGAFQSQLPVALLWKCEWHRPNRDRSSSKPYVAPTWSWASVDSGVDTSDWMCHALAKVKSISIDLDDSSNQFGKLRHAAITIEGLVMEIPAEPITYGNPQRQYEGPLRLKLNYTQFRFAWDNNPATSPACGEIWYLLRIGRYPGKQIYHGIVLRRIEECNSRGKELFKRVGHWTSYMDKKEEGVEVVKFISVRDMLVTLV